jgi:hypothetical protein
MVVVVLDEAVLGAIDTFAAKQGESGETAKDLDNDIVCEASQCAPLIGASFVSSMCSRMRACSIMRSLKRKIIQQRSNSKVHNSYQSVTLTTINNFHGTTSNKFRVASQRYITQTRVVVNGAIIITILAKSSLSITLPIST